MTMSIFLLAAAMQPAAPAQAAQIVRLARRSISPGHRVHRASGARSIVAGANRAATREPVHDAFINASQVFPFSDGAIYHVYASPERVTDIALEPGEELGAVASGDTARWLIGDTASGSGPEKRTHVLVKPFASGLSTNLVVTTNRRTYHLIVTSQEGVAMSSLSWTYPAGALIALKPVPHATAEPAADGALPRDTGLAVEQLRFGYVISGHRPAWRPLRAFDDGRQVFIEFPASIAAGEAPPLFVLGESGAPELVNYRQRGHFYVVDRLFDAAELRLGRKHQQVVRISFAARAGSHGSRK